MSHIAPDFAELLPSRQAAIEPDDRPLNYLWVFDPHERKVHLDHNEDKHPAHNEDKHPAHHVTHDEIAPHVKDPVHGNAHSIKGGWRITEMGPDAKDRPVEDAFILRQIEKALARKHPPKPLAGGFLSSVEEPDAALPQIRYHGAP